MHFMVTRVQSSIAAQVDHSGSVAPSRAHAMSAFGWFYITRRSTKICVRFVLDGRICKNDRHPKQQVSYKEDLHTSR